MFSIADIHGRASKKNATIILAEADDPRVIKAAKIAEKKKLAKLILLGENAFDSFPEKQRAVDTLVKARKQKGMTPQKARMLLKDTKYLAAVMVHMGMADGYIAGNICPTAETLRPALQVLHHGFASSHFLMVHKGRPLLFADCALNPHPDAKQLAQIAVQSADSAKLYGMKPKVAMLSFSTKGSADHGDVTLVRKATRSAQRKLGKLIDGELQFDAAFDPDVAKRKAPKSPVAGKANVFIFPDLNSGNIGYKIARELAHDLAIGPIVQGLAKPVNDLSRSCSVEEIVDVIAITALQK